MQTTNIFNPPHINFWIALEVGLIQKKKITGENFLCVFEAVEKKAKEFNQEINQHQKNKNVTHSIARFTK